MKKLIVAVAVGMVCLGAMAQGRVAFQNNSTRLVYFDATKMALTQAEATALSLVADLYVGKAQDNLILGMTSTSWSAVAPGQWTTLTANLPAGYAGGVDLFAQVQIRPSTFASAAAAAAGGGLYGYSDVFTFRANTGTVVGNSVLVTGSPSFSTWAAGTQPVLGAAPGAMGAIALIVPEPSSFALAGLGAAALLIFRRRN